MTAKKFLVAALLLISTSVWAHDCPNLMKELDDLIAAKPDLDEETIIDEENFKKVKQLRQQGEEFHNAGKHDESVEVLNEALELLRNEV